MPAQRKKHAKAARHTRRYIVTAAFMLVLGGYIALLFPHFSSAVRTSPRRANYFLWWDIPSSKIAELARYDLLVLDMETQVTSPAALKKIKELNPDIILLAYITPQEIKSDAASGSSVMRRKLAVGIDQQWYITDLAQQKKSFWPGTWMLNVADNAPQINGIRFNQYLAQFVSKEILATGMWDGVFYDNAWREVQWVIGPDADLDKDGQKDSDIDAHWQEGMRALFRETRRLAGNPYYIVGNAPNDAYKNDLNGIMLESFPASGWKETMRIYASTAQGGPLPRFMIINANTANKGTQTSNLKKFRFGLASTLMVDGYYSFDYGDQNHGQTWWYDEYDVELGKAISPPLSLNNKAQFEEDVWRREYENGIAIVNSTGQAQDVDLGGEYEKLSGTQDKTTNNGAIVSQVNLPSKDGLIMLRTFQTLKNLVFGNGNFVRFFNAAGNRARNGLFIYEDDIAGGASIYYGDLDADGLEEKIVANGPKLQIFNNAGQIWFEGFPFGNYKGDLRIAIGTLAGSKTKSIVVTQASGGQAIIYNYHGGVIKENIFPLGKNYKGGLSVAVLEDRNTNPDKNGQIVVGKASGSRPEVVIYNNTFSKVNKRFFVDSSKLKGELSIATGDIDGNKTKEIIVAYDYGRFKQVKIYQPSGKLISQFKTSISFANGHVSVGAVDVDFDGKDEIVLMNKQ